MDPMSELTSSMRRHRQELFALFMIAIVLLLLWLARGALPAFFIGLALAFVLDPGVTALVFDPEAAPLPVPLVRGVSPEDQQQAKRDADQ